MLGVFVTSIHQSKTRISGSFEPMPRNACVHRLDLGLYSHPKEFWGERVRTHANSKGKSPLPVKFSPEEIESMMLHQAGQRTQHTTNELFQPLKFCQINTCHFSPLSVAELFYLLSSSSSSAFSALSLGFTILVRIFHM